MSPSDVGDTGRSGADPSHGRGNSGATSDAAGLVRMLNQIAANVAHHPHDQAVAEIAAHLRASWAPAMRAELYACLDGGGPGLTPLAAAAADRLQAETTRSSPA
jgi:formate dehydrogenase subunit delta